MASMTQSIVAARTFSGRKSFSGSRVAPARTLPVHGQGKNIRAARFQTSAQIGLFFSTTTGNTEEVADLIADSLGDAVSAPADIGDVADDLSQLLNFDGLVVGTPTWNTGADENRSGTAWDDVIDELKGMDFSGKKVAIFGCGDSSSYSDYFCDAIEEMHSIFSGAGAEMVGANSTEGYDFEESKSCVGGPQSSDEADKMLGLAIDVENQADMTEDRVSAWCANLKGEMGL